MAVKTATLAPLPPNFNYDANILYKYLTNNSYPDFELPANKVVLSDQMTDVHVTKHPTGVNRLLKKGCTAVSYKTRPIENTVDYGFLSQGGFVESGETSFDLGGDPASFDPNTWQIGVQSRPDHRFLLWDGEFIPTTVFHPYSWTNAHVAKHSVIATAQRSYYGGTGHIGNWISNAANGTFEHFMNHDQFRIGDLYAGINIWEHPLYNNKGGSYNAFVNPGAPGSAFNSPPDNLAGNLSTIYWYESPNYGSKVHYGAIGLLETLEVNKRVFGNNSLKNLTSIWGDIEVIDGGLNHNFEWHDGQSRNYIIKGKASASNAYLYGSTLYSTCLGNGIYIFGNQLAKYSDNPAHGAINGPDGYPAFRTFNYTKNGQVLQSRQLEYPAKYLGQYDEIYKCLYQLSQQPFRSILEASTPWLFPEYTDPTSTLRTGYYLQPKLASSSNLPLIRTKVSADGTTAMIIAWNPSMGKAKNTYSVKLPNGTDTTNITLVGGMPRLFSVTL